MMGNDALVLKHQMRLDEAIEFQIIYQDLPKKFKDGCKYNGIYFRICNYPQFFNEILYLRGVISSRDLNVVIVRSFSKWKQIKNAVKMFNDDMKKPDIVPDDCASSKIDGFKRLSQTASLRSPSQTSGFHSPSQTVGFRSPSQTSGVQSCSTSCRTECLTECGPLSVAAAVGERSTVRCEYGGVCVVVAEDCYWIPEPETTFIQKWVDVDGWHTAIFEAKSKNIGKKIHIVCGEPVQ